MCWPTPQHYYENKGTIGSPTFSREKGAGATNDLFDEKDDLGWAAISCFDAYSWGYSSTWYGRTYHYHYTDMDCIVCHYSGCDYYEDGHSSGGPGGSYWLLILILFIILFMCCAACIGGLIFGGGIALISTCCCRKHATTNQQNQLAQQQYAQGGIVMVTMAPVAGQQTWQQPGMHGGIAIAPMASVQPVQSAKPMMAEVVPGSVVPGPVVYQSSGNVAVSLHGQGPSVP